MKLETGKLYRAAKSSKCRTIEQGDEIQLRDNGGLFVKRFLGGYGFLSKEDVEEATKGAEFTQVDSWPTP